MFNKSLNYIFTNCHLSVDSNCIYFVIIPLVEQISGQIWPNRGFNDKSMTTSKNVASDLLNKKGYDPSCNFSIWPPFSRWVPNITDIFELTKTNFFLPEISFLMVTSGIRESIPKKNGAPFQNV